MLAYQVMVEGVFVSISENTRTRYGFHSTFYMEANNAQNAVQRVGKLMNERLEHHDVKRIETGIFETYVLVQDIWEITSDKLSKNQGKDFGFSFFRIGRIESIYLYFRRLFLSRFRPWLMVRSNSTAVA